MDTFIAVAIAVLLGAGLAVVFFQLMDARRQLDRYSDIKDLEAHKEKLRSSAANDEKKIKDLQARISKNNA